MRNFRNHVETAIDFGEGINALLGNNGQGKTNVLEAVSYLSLTKSFYASSDATVLRFGNETFDVEGIVRTDAGTEHTIRAAYSRSGEKVFSVNGVKPETMASVIGRFPIVVLSPENNAITFGGPGERRKFMDLLLSQISRSYLDDVLEYRRVLKQRNRLLAEAKYDQAFSSELLGVWTAGLVQYGARIVRHRLVFAREFQNYVSEAYAALVGIHEKPELSYSSIDDLDAREDEASIAELMSEALEQRKYDERKRGTTLVGPHRDDLRLSINGIGVQQYASQGQHKTMLVALKIAEFFYLKERRGEVPVLLLDDVFSELDDGRSRLLLQTVAPLGQVFITTTEGSVFRDTVHWNGSNRRFFVEAGTVRSC